MVTVEVLAKLTVDELLAAVEKLPTAELTEFARQVISLQAQRGVPLFIEEEERALLAIIEAQHLTDEAQARFDVLRKRSQDEMLSTDEHAELLGLVQQTERQDVTRLEALLTLAKKRGVSVSELMSELGLTATYA